MKYEKLMQMVKKEKLYDRLVISLAILAATIIIGSMILILLSILKITTTVATIGVVMTLVLCICVYILSAKARKYIFASYDYIYEKIIDIIVQAGVETENFKMIEELGVIHIGFHNQKIDYEELQSKLDLEVNEMNKITGRNVIVKLI